MTRAEIIAFAVEFDPQPAHLDERAARDTFAGGLIASGWHGGAMFMRMLCDGLLMEASSMGSPGIDTLKWRRPIRAGDTLTAYATVLSSRVSKSRSEMGIIRFRHEVVNQTDDIVMWMETPILFRRREPGQ